MPAIVMQLFGQDFVLTETSKWLGHTLGRDVLIRTISDEARLRGLPASYSIALVMPATSKWLRHTLGRDVEARLRGLPASSSSALVMPAVVMQLFGQDFVLTETSKWLGHALGRDVLINTIYDEARLRTKRKWIHLGIYVQDRDKQVDKSNKIA
jgi:hypothetical protein